MEIDRPSRAKTFFEMVRLPENGARFLNQLIGSETPAYESEFLDFKGGYGLQIDDLKRLWAKNLSCFANSEGGVIVFGIDAPKGSAKSLSVVQDVGRLLEQLKALLPTITEPPVQGVELESYPVHPGANTGFVVCFIPPSPWRPHQVRLDGQPGQIYIRAADNCIPCGVSTLRALFAPQLVSRLEVQYHVTIRPPHAIYHWREVFIHCRIENAGPATASELFVLCDFPRNVVGPHYDHRLWKETVSGRPGIALIAERSVHPQERLNLFDFQLGQISTDGAKTFGAESFTFNLSISARNQVPLKYVITVRVDEIEDATLKSATTVI